MPLPQLVPYIMGLKTPVPVAGQFIEEKHGAFLTWERKGQLHWGEMPCLPGFLPLSLQEGCDLLRRLPWDKWSDLPMAQALEELWTGELPGQVRFAAETLLMSATWDNMAIDVPVNVLYAPSPKIPFDQHLKNLADLVKLWEKTSVRTIKMKIGRLPLSQESFLLKEMARRMPGVQWRLDGNRLLGAHELRLWVNSTVGINVEYFESPLKPGTSPLPGVPLGLDEEALQILEKGKAPREVKAVILRPTMLGIAQTLAMAQEAQHLGIKIVISSTYEGPVGLRALAWVHREAGGGRNIPAAGLGTWSYVSNQDNLLALCHFEDIGPFYHYSSMRFLSYNNE